MKTRSSSTKQTKSTTNVETNNRMTTKVEITTVEKTKKAIENIATRKAFERSTTFVKH